MKTTINLLALLLTASLIVSCQVSPAGQYSVAKVQKGLKAAAAKGVISAAQADQVGVEIASVPEGIDWGGLASTIVGGAVTLGVGLAGLRYVPNGLIIGKQEAAHIDTAIAKDASA
jgi:hypothetical protein